MGDNTKIEWTDATWNVINGCSVVSPGCKHCYAMKQAHRFPARRGLTEKTAGGMVWTGEVRFNDAVLDQPLRWRRARRIFVCAHGDLFHENVQVQWIDKVFAIMAMAPQHIFQVLTKRPENMLAYMANAETIGRVAAAAMVIAKNNRSVRLGDVACGWPLPNVWLGTSVEDQKRADERIPHLLATPSAVRWLSMEPLLGPVDIRWALSHVLDIAAGFLARGHFSPGLETLRRLDWIVAGGESGPRARDNDFETNARSLRDQCAAANVPFFGKQNFKKMPLPEDLMVREYPHA